MEICDDSRLLVVVMKPIPSLELLAVVLQGQIHKYGILKAVKSLLAPSLFFRTVFIQCGSLIV